MIHARLCHIQARSNTLTLDSSQKKMLDKRRQSSLATRRTQNRRNLPIRINKVWQCFAQYLIDQQLEQKRLDKEQKEEEKEEKEQPAEDVLDSIINATNDNANKEAEKRRIKQESLDVLDIDPRLFLDAKSKSRENSQSSRGSESSSIAQSDSDLMIDVYSLELSYSQFNIVLNNNNIEVSPDMSAALIWLLLDVNEMIPTEVMTLGLDSDNFHNDPMKERSFHNKQFKKIFKCKISYTMIECIMKKIAGGIITRQDKSLHPKHLSYETRNYVIWDKIFEHLINATSFNVESEYLYGALSEEELTNSQTIVSMLSTLDSHWQHRVQLMEHIDDKLRYAHTQSDHALSKIVALKQFFSCEFTQSMSHLKQRIPNGERYVLCIDISG